MHLNIATTPFSKYGSYVSLGCEEEGILIRNVRQRGGREKTFILTFEHEGQTVTPVVEAQPHLIRVTAPQGSARIYLRGDHGVVIASEGLDVYLRMAGAGFIFHEGERRIKTHHPSSQVYGIIDVLRGQGSTRMDRYIADDGIQRVGHVAARVQCDGGQTLVQLTLQMVETPLPTPDVRVDAEIAEVQAEWDAFLAGMPTVPPARRAAAELAWYNLWSATVRAQGMLKYDAIFMSKANMAAMWSWDHCFNALAVAQHDRQLGLQQWLLPFELQPDTGQLPDHWVVDEATWLVTKPPIHGWCIQRLLAGGEVDADLLCKIYGHLEKWTNWWFTFRDTDGDGIPNYVSGVDSGWDNSTLFDPDICPEAPDLSAFLVLQMHALAEIAERLGDTAQASSWRTRAADLLQRLYEHSWEGDGFVAKVSGTHTCDTHPTSLLILMPLALGEHLDADKFAHLTARLERDFLTANGPATEAPSSPLYMPDGYWRGPIWAPSTCLIVDGLRRGGRMDLAKEIARRFCDMVERAGGNYENYDALTGVGLRDQGYTWTASVNLLLMHEYLLPT